MSSYPILFLTSNMENYSGAMYQQDIINETKKQFDVYFYGPGFSHYNSEDTIQEILNKSNKKIKAIILGHSCLSDEKGSNKIMSFGKFDLRKTKLPKIALLNKEYVNLEEKLEFLKVNNFDLCFTHHHDAKEYEKLTNIKFIFWPFATCSSLLEDNKIKKVFDIGFSGTLKNSNHKQSNLRIEVMKKLFHVVFNIPIRKRNLFKEKKIVWNSKPENIIAKIYNKYVFKFYYYLQKKDYYDFIKSSKIFINTLSPADLVSPRCFECMASRTLVICEMSDIYKNIFPDNVFVQFSNADTFVDKAIYYLSNSEKREEITNMAFNFVKESHTWEVRIQTLKKKIDTLISDHDE